MQSLNWIKEKNPQNDFLPSPRDGHTLNYIPELGCLILYGGFQCNEKPNEVFLYDIEKNAWKLQPTVGKPPTTRTYHSAFYEDSYFFVYGGQGENNKVLGDLNFLNVITWEWKSLWVLEAPPARKLSPICDMANQEKEKILFGGSASPDNKKLLGDVWIISYNNVSFNSINQKIVGTVCTSKRPKGDIPPPRAGHTAVVHNKSMIVYGGKTDSAEDANSIYQLLFETWTWKKIAGASKSLNSRSFAASCQFEADSLLLFGGLDNQTGKSLNDIIVLDLVEFKWSDPFVSGHLPMPRYNHAACVYETVQKEKSMAILGGLEVSHCNMGLFRLVAKNSGSGASSLNSIENPAPVPVRKDVENTLSQQKSIISELENTISREKENNMALENQIDSLEEELSALQAQHRSKVKNATERIETLDNEYFVNYDNTKNLFSLIPIEQLILTEIGINNSMLEEVIQKSESYLIGLDKLFLAISKYKFDESDQHEVRLRDLFENSQDEVYKLRDQHRESLYYMKNVYDDNSAFSKKVDNDINKLRQQILEIDENYREILIQSETEEL